MEPDPKVDIGKYVDLNARIPDSSKDDLDALFKYVESRGWTWNLLVTYIIDLGVSSADKLFPILKKARMQNKELEVAAKKSARLQERMAAQQKKEKAKAEREAEWASRREAKERNALRIKEERIRLKAERDAMKVELDHKARMARDGVRAMRHEMREKAKAEKAIADLRKPLLPPGRPKLIDWSNDRWFSFPCSTITNPLTGERCPNTVHEIRLADAARQNLHRTSRERLAMFIRCDSCFPREIPSTPQSPITPPEDLSKYRAIPELGGNVRVYMDPTPDPTVPPPPSHPEDPYAPPPCERDE